MTSILGALSKGEDHPTIATFEYGGARWSYAQQEPWKSNPYKCRSCENSLANLTYHLFENVDNEADEYRFCEKCFRATDAYKITSEQLDTYMKKMFAATNESNAKIAIVGQKTLYAMMSELQKDPDANKKYNWFEP